MLLNLKHAANTVEAIVRMLLSRALLSESLYWSTYCKCLHHTPCTACLHRATAASACTGQLQRARAPCNKDCSLSPDLGCHKW